MHAVHPLFEGTPPDDSGHSVRREQSGGMDQPTTANPAPSCVAALRVAKTYRPSQNGAKRFAARYGRQLVCVRQRLSDDGGTRHTTVELLIESTPVASRSRSLVAVRIPPMDKKTRVLLLACGASWHPKQRYWLLQRIEAKNLGLLDYFVGTRG